MAKQNRGRKSVALLVVIIGLLLLIGITGEGREELTPVEDLLLGIFAAPDVFLFGRKANAVAL